MIHFIKSIIFIFIFLSVQKGETETLEQQALDAVQKNYEKVLTFEAEFVQKSYVKMMDKTQGTKGTVSIALRR